MVDSSISTDSGRAIPIRLLVIPDKYAPDELGGGGIYTDMCRGLAARGFDVTVRAPYPFYPEWIDKSGKNGIRIDRYEEAGVHVERFGFLMPGNPKSLYSRLLVDLTFFLSLSRSIFRGHFDAVIAFCPHTGGLAHGAMVSGFRHIPLWLNVQDIPADAASAGGMNRNKFLGKLLQRVQRWLFNRGDFWSTISPVMMERLNSLRDRGQPIVFLPNWTHLSLSDVISRLPSKRGRLLSFPVRLLYSGNIATKQGLLEFCEFLSQSRASFDFLIRGGGGGAPAVKEWVESCGDPRFRFDSLGDEANFAKALFDSDFFVVTEKAGSGASFFPSKTVPSMASATPILAISDPRSPLGREMAERNLGPWFHWENLCENFDQMLVQVVDQPEIYREWQENGVFRSNEFDRTHCMDLIEDSIHRLSRDLTKGLTHVVEEVGGI